MPCPPRTTSAAASLRRRMAAPVALAPGSARGRGRRRVLGARRADPRRRLRRRRRLHGALDGSPDRRARARRIDRRSWRPTSAAGGRPDETAASRSRGGPRSRRWSSAPARRRPSGSCGPQSRRSTSSVRSASAKESMRTIAVAAGSGRRPRPLSSSPGRGPSRPRPGPASARSRSCPPRRCSAGPARPSISARPSRQARRPCSRRCSRGGFDGSPSSAGVRIFERSPMVELDRERGVVRTPSGSVEAGAIVLATGAWLAAVPELGRASSRSRATWLRRLPCPSGSRRRAGPAASRSPTAA